MLLLFDLCVVYFTSSPTCFEERGNTPRSHCPGIPHPSAFQRLLDVMSAPKAWHFPVNSNLSDIGIMNAPWR